MISQTEHELTGFPSIDKPWLKYYNKEAIQTKPFAGSIYRHILQNNQEYQDNCALQYFGNKISYREMFHKADIVASAFANYGVKEGDKVILIMTSCPELVYILLALNKIGAVANMINPLFTQEQIRDRINDTNAEVMIVLDQFWGLIDSIFQELCIKRTVVVPIVESMPTITKLIASIKLKKKILYSQKILSFRDFLKINDGKSCKEECKSDIPAIMVYSSGTTGASKGIVLTNKGMNATIAHYEHTGFEYKRNYTYLQIVPVWFSTGAVLCLFMPLCFGLSLIIEPVFSEENFSKDILRYKPNIIMGATSLWLHFLNNIKGKNIDLSFITYPITGGEKTLPGTERKLNEVLHQYGCKYHLITGYGMCELGATATSTSMNWYKPGSAGYPIKGVTVAAFNDESNKECKYNQRGEIRILTPARMKEYYKRPDATKEFFWRDPDGNEWGCTGDVGYVDQDGFLFVEGRATDYFTTKSGEKIYNFDIENVILEVDGVYQCEVVGRKQPDGYEEAFAFIIFSEKANKDKVLSEVQRICKKRLKTEQIPVEFRVLESFPVKPSGKRDMEKLIRIAAES